LQLAFACVAAPQSSCAAPTFARALVLAVQALLQRRAAAAAARVYVRVCVFGRACALPPPLLRSLSLQLKMHENEICRQSACFGMTTLSNWTEIIKIRPLPSELGPGQQWP
jgi:hypothetical protein